MPKRHSFTCKTDLTTRAVEKLESGLQEFTFAIDECIYEVVVHSGMSESLVTVRMILPGLSECETFTIENLH